VEILFQPNRNFRPPSHEAAVLHGMEGRIWIDEKENRLAEIEGHLIRPVKFYGGLLSHLDKGGTFHVKQSNVARGHWEIPLLQVNMHGKALFFKTISVQQNESRGDFQPMPENITLAQLEELQKHCKASDQGHAGPINHWAERRSTIACTRPLHEDLRSAGARLLGRVHRSRIDSEGSAKPARFGKVKSEYSKPPMLRSIRFS